MSDTITFEHAGFECQVRTLAHSRLCFTAIVAPWQHSLSVVCNEEGTRFALRAERIWHDEQTNRATASYVLHTRDNPYLAWLFADKLDAIAMISVAAEYFRGRTRV